jgi:hypothetical protein
VHEDFVEAQKSESFKDLGEKLRRDSVHIRVGETQGEELAEERRQRSRPLNN